MSFKRAMYVCAATDVGSASGMGCSALYLHMSLGAAYGDPEKVGRERVVRDDLESVRDGVEGSVRDVRVVAVEVVLPLEDGDEERVPVELVGLLVGDAVAAAVVEDRERVAVAHVRGDLVHAVAHDADADLGAADDEVAEGVLVEPPDRADEVDDAVVAAATPSCRFGERPTTTPLGVGFAAGRVARRPRRDVDAVGEARDGRDARVGPLERVVLGLVDGRRP
eukprot:CAMPEP_0185703598 /NCGR_PEP_ID=MMETSP1164-20130828/14993_1 /TAXON_ID=1104430 /ORGANISM="Chrysoreinhardia sp, Strain CCMP2950" /LENGTH=222 /DNA_ID=CAMNT_0028370893 /DNA_START=180 /DNA_END=844 /DNA_ORIENTATION=-